MGMCRHYFPSKVIPQNFTELSGLNFFSRKNKILPGKKIVNSSLSGFLFLVAKRNREATDFANTEVISSGRYS